MEYFATEGSLEPGADILTAPPEAAGERADVTLSRLASLSRANIQKLMKAGLVLLAGKAVKPNYRIEGGEEFTLDYRPPQPIAVTPENLPIEIVYQDKDLIIVNKARGMVVHPAPGHPGGTLVNALLYHCHDLSGINGRIRPGIVHRLDKDTSGLMAVAKNDAAHIDLAAQIQSKTAHREYLAIVHGRPKKESGLIETLIDRDAKDRQKMAVVAKGGRTAITEYRLEENWGAYSLLRLRLYTGRTHQIRVHLAYLGYPVVGDPKYLPRRHPFAIAGQALHSTRLQIVSPSGGQLDFTAPLPPDMQKIITRLSKT
jgi:23S rRNA pseudouridine1911/1915/1917 synthase